MILGFFSRLLSRALGRTEPMDQSAQALDARAELPWVVTASSLQALLDHWHTHDTQKDLAKEDV